MSEAPGRPEEARSGSSKACESKRLYLENRILKNNLKYQISKSARVQQLEQRDRKIFKETSEAILSLRDKSKKLRFLKKAKGKMENKTSFL